ncbi:piggyBac transposable element-derived protein 4-like, partial [Clarias magur]
MLGFIVSQDLDHIFNENEQEDTEQHSDTDEQVSEEEDIVEYLPEAQTHLMSLMRRSLMLKLHSLLRKHSNPKV